MTETTNRDNNGQQSESPAESGLLLRDEHRTANERAAAIPARVQRLHQMTSHKIRVATRGAEAAGPKPAARSLPEGLDGVAVIARF
jgi:hypothetical protein